MSATAFCRKSFLEIKFMVVIPTCVPDLKILYVPKKSKFN